MLSRAAVCVCYGIVSGRGGRRSRRLSGEPRSGELVPRRHKQQIQISIQGRNPPSRTCPTGRATVTR
jgi:hypothetical protein